MATRLRYRRIRAFTLIELLIVTAIISIVFAVGLPGIHTLSGNSRVVNATNTMVRHLHYARSEAVRLVSNVVLCPSHDGLRCVNNTEWQDGFILFADRNGNRIRDLADPLLRHHQPDKRGIKILTTSGRRKLVYRASGTAHGSTATITICDRRKHAQPKAIILSNPGRPRLSHTKVDGSPLECR